jgi:hypothetical protein
MMASWFKKIGEILGLETGPILYSLRYNAANEFDQSGPSFPLLPATTVSADVT